ncbi:MAG: helix-turn-helix transcriptional regulator, partial [Shewanella sp.]|nr:helix-turn-helix transcriptional regulator [Shewanella sp.]
MTLGQIIKKCRVEKGLSQPELADKIGIEQSYLSKLENDKSLPSNDMLQAILLAFDIKLEAILSSIESSSEKKRLKQIPIVNDW